MGPPTSSPAAAPQKENPHTNHQKNPGDVTKQIMCRDTGEDERAKIKKIKE